MTVRRVGNHGAAFRLERACIAVFGPLMDGYPEHQWADVVQKLWEVGLVVAEDDEALDEMARRDPPFPPSTIRHLP